MQTLEVICPVRNEELVIPLFFERITRVFHELKGRYECRLVFIDNASTDSTLDIVKSLGDPRVRIHTNIKNIGAENNFNLCIHIKKNAFYI
jgi:glycosyltransferase involved in cell wall biosynthesis